MNEINDLSSHAKSSMGTLYEVGQQIRGCRKEKGWTQTKLALEVGVTWQTISAIENGQRNAGSKELYDRLGTVLEMTFDISFPLVEGKHKKD